MSNTSMFGITKDTKSSNLLPIEPPKKDNAGNWVYPIAYLMEVKADPAYETKKGEKPVLSFKFVNSDKTKQFIHFEWAIDDMNATNAADRLAAMQSRIKHIFETYEKFPEQGIIPKEETFESFFEAVEMAFHGKKAKNSKASLIFTEKEKPIPVYLKLVYNNQNTIQFPYAPNFIERQRGNAPKTLNVNLKYDKVEQAVGSGGVTNAALPGMGGASDVAGDDAGLPQFDD